MKQANETEYGPLTALLGTWKGDKGLDVAPEPDGPDENPYYETIEFAAVGGIDNADRQDLAAIWYRQIVCKKKDDRIFHDETGYWMWDPSDNTVMHSLSIPRAVSLLAGGQYAGAPDANGNIVLDVTADEESDDWQIIQSPFMRDNARTIKFTHNIIVAKDALKYVEVTTLDIYGKVFLHSDQNELKRVL